MLNRHTHKNTLQNARMPLGDVWCLHPDQLLNTNMQHARWFNMTFLIHLASLSLIKLEVPKGHSTVQTDKKDQIQAIWSFRISKHRQFRIQIHGEAMQILPVVSSRSSSCPLNSVWLRRYWCESKLLHLSLSKSELCLWFAAPYGEFWRGFSSIQWSRWVIWATRVMYFPRC